MKITALIVIFSLFFLSTNVFAGGKSGEPIVLREQIIYPPPLVLEEEEVCEWENIPGGILQENISINSPSIGVFICPFFMSGGSISQGVSPIMGSGTRKVCYKREVKK